MANCAAAPASFLVPRPCTSTFPVQIAVNLKIPLIIWGAHQGVDQVGMFSHTDEVEMTRKYRKEHDLMGFEAEDMISEKNEIFERDMAKNFYPSDKDIETIGVRGIYLNNYIRWDSKIQHESMITKYNYETLLQTTEQFNNNLRRQIISVKTRFFLNVNINNFYVWIHTNDKY